MIPWVQLGSAVIPGGAERLFLFRRGEEFSIRVGERGGELMNSRMHASEDALARLACARLAGLARPRVLIGGLGMGFTLAVALENLGPAAEVTVAELVPGVVEWNHAELGECAGYPLRDPRTRVHVGDVGELLRSERAAFDAVLLDVDNGPEGMTRQENDWLYGRSGLSAAASALRPGGVLGVWSATPDEAFTARLIRLDFRVETHVVRARQGKGARHTIWLAQRPGAAG